VRDLAECCQMDERKVREILKHLTEENHAELACVPG
jgi:hypothetical protein